MHSNVFFINHLTKKIFISSRSQIIIHILVQLAANGSVYAPFIGKGFAKVLILGYVDSCHAKTVTITNGV